MRIEAQDYYATIEQGLLRVYAKRRTIQKTTYVEGKAVTEELTLDNTTDESSKEFLRVFSKYPVFAATYGGSGEWHCDIEAGFQRWNGIKSGKAVAKALRSCGFKIEDVIKITKLCRATPWDYCPRQN